MTLFKRPLGFWAPMPGAGADRSRQARFWAFLHAERVSLADERRSVLLLSVDGGHFDNTGCMSLVERGARISSPVDCGADPSRTFADMGELVRLAESISARRSTCASTDCASSTRRRAYIQTASVVGTVHSTISTARHRRSHTVGHGGLYRPHQAVAARHRSARRPAIRLRQQDVSQQSTVDQFFDEPQFESYRRLGLHCGERRSAR